MEADIAVNTDTGRPIDDASVITYFLRAAVQVILSLFCNVILSNRILKILKFNLSGKYVVIEK